MKAAVYESFGGPLTVRDCPDPSPAPHGAVLEVQATGVCRSDWHGWRGHDPDIRLPHVPGHELAGDVAAAVAAVSDGGAELSLDAFGSAATCRNSILGLCRRGRHVQVGLLVGDERDAPLPMAEIIARELCVVGSHGMQAPAYASMLELIRDGRLAPGRLVAQRVSLEEAAAGFGDERYLHGDGITVIDRFVRAT